MNNDLIKRNIAIAYATSGLIRRIDGEDWIRVSEVVQSLKDVPTVDIPCNDCCADTYRDGYEKGKADVRPQGEWIESGVNISGHRLNRCSICNGIYQMSYVGDSLTRWNYCPNCGAKMGGEEP